MDWDESSDSTESFVRANDSDLLPLADEDEDEVRCEEKVGVTTASTDIEATTDVESPGKAQQDEQQQEDVPPEQVAVTAVRALVGSVICWLVRRARMSHRMQLQREGSSW